MQLKYTVLAAALSASVAADFVIYTIPIPRLDGDVRPSHPSKLPTASLTPTQIASALASFSSAAESRVADLTKSVPTSQVAQAISANSALRNFVSTASISVPPQVTEIGKYERFSTTPSWYSALPSDLRSYYDGNNARVQSVINEVAGRTPSSAGPSQTGTAAGAQGTGAAGTEKVGRYMGVGAAAAFGVFVL